MADNLKTVLITGAAGFIGWHTVLEFLKQGWFVCALVHKNNSAKLKELQEQDRIRIVKGEMTSLESMQSVFSNCPAKLSAVVHCAGRASDVGWESRFRKNNYYSVQHLVELVKQYNVGRFVFVSTTDVYGLKDFNGQTENELPYDEKARNNYPKYKIMAEKWIRENLSANRYCIIRPAAVWGDDDPTLTKRVRHFLAWSPFIVHFGKWKGKNRWPLVHVDNVARANCLAATSPQAVGEAINVLDPHYTSIDEFYRMVSEKYFPQKKYRTVILPFWLGVCIGATVSGLSNLLNLSQPFIDPSLYALYSVSRNLDFSCEKYLQLDRSVTR